MDELNSSESEGESEDKSAPTKARSSTANNTKQLNEPREINPFCMDLSEQDPWAILQQIIDEEEPNSAETSQKKKNDESELKKKELEAKRALTKKREKRLKRRMRREEKRAARVLLHTASNVVTVSLHSFNRFNPLNFIFLHLCRTQLPSNSLNNPVCLQTQAGTMMAQST